MASAAATLMDNEDHNSVNLVVVTLNLQTGTPCLLVMCLFFGSTAEAEEYTASIKAIGPVVAMENRKKYSEINDGMDGFCAKGGFKLFKLMGATRFDPEPWAEVANIFVDLKERCPHFVSGGYGFEWVTGKQKEAGMDSRGHRRRLSLGCMCISFRPSQSDESLREES